MAETGRCNFAGALLLLVILFTASRGLLLFTRVEQVSDLEELYRGALALEIAGGLHAPLWNYQADPYAAGSLFAAVLAAPLFTVFGPSLGTLKLVPFLFSFLTFLTLYFFLRRHFSRREALWGGLFFIFAPPSLIRWSLTALGSHAEALLFQILMLAAFAEGVKTENRIRSRLFFFFAGCAGGLGFWFDPMSGPALLALAAAWLCGGWPRRRAAFFCGAGLATGLLPWFFYNVARGGDGLRFMAGLFIRPVPPPAAVSGDFLIRLSEGFGFSDLHASAGVWWGWIYLAACAAALLAGWRDKKSLLKLPLLIYVPLTCLIFLMIPSQEAGRGFLGSRFFIPLQFFMLLNAAVFGARIPWLRPLVLTAGIAGQAMLFAQPAEPMGRAFAYRGYSYEQLGETCAAIWSREVCHENIFSRPFLSQPENLKDFYRGLLPARGADVPALNETAAAQMLEETPAAFRPDVMESLGRIYGRQLYDAGQGRVPFERFVVPELRSRFYQGFFDNVFLKGPAALDFYRGIAQTLDPPSAHWFYFYTGFLAFEEPAVLNRLPPDRLSRADQEWFLRGLGYQAASLWCYDRLPLNRVIARLPEFVRARPEIFWGLGWGLRHEMAEDRLRALDWLERLPAEFRAAAREGLEAYEKNNR